jgi:type IV pilus assembly protein PilY1
MSNAEYGDGEKKWVAIFGNGYNSTSADGDAAIYILFIEAGQDGVWTAGSDYIKISTGYGKAESSDGTTPNGVGAVRGIDIDNDGTVDRLYAGDLQGNLYRVDISSANASAWDDSANRDIIFKARYGPAGSRTIVQPFTKRPIVVKHPSEPGYIVIAATGSWMTSDDATSTDIQSIYGIWDNNTGYEVTMPSANNQLVEQEFTNHLIKEHGFTVRSLSNNAVVWKDTGSSSNKVMGWYIDFDIPPAGSNSGVEYPGERAVRNLQLRGDFLFVNTVIPKGSSPCNNGAGGFELAFDPFTGGSGSKIVFDISADGQFDVDDNISDTLGDAYIVSGIRFDSTTPTDAAFIGHYRLTQQSDRSVRSIGTNTRVSNAAGRNSWRELIIQ